MLWIKAVHIFAVVSWFAGLLYLPRLFVYHVGVTDPAGNERFQTMESRLYYGVMLIALILTVTTGVMMLMIMPGYLTQGWLHAKFLLVALVILFHIYCGMVVRTFKQNKNKHNALYYKLINEIPAVLLIAIIILAVVKPF